MRKEKGEKQRGEKKKRKQRSEERGERDDPGPRFREWFCSCGLLSFCVRDTCLHLVSLINKLFNIFFEYFYIIRIFEFLTMNNDIIMIIKKSMS